MNTEPVGKVESRWLALFEDRYGVAAYEQLMADLRQPCLTFAAIARRFGVTRERVRQWQRLLLPGAPRGHERKRLCALQRRRRRLLEDPLFRTFFRHARTALDSSRLELIVAHDRYRTRAARIDRRVVVLRTARRLSTGRPGPDAPVYRLSPGRSADLLYYQLSESDFLLLPASELPGIGARFVDRPGAPYARYKNTFHALDAIEALESGLGSA